MTAVTAPRSHPGAPERRPVRTGIDGSKAIWSDGSHEEVDAIVMATGYRPELPHLAGLDGALDDTGHPRYREGIAASIPGPAFVGLEWQRSLSSDSLRGVGRDAARGARRLAADHAYR
ncbi:hypothetical protein ACFWDQ_20080 [Streptomyces sp. NPDC060053]|uniref:hypothetical protein n=1 Tax=Streptomyces sp. NPDC060053 TaxID=3347047 RepID=UPI00367D1E1D